MNAIVLYAIARTQYFLACEAGNDAMMRFWNLRMNEADRKLTRDGR